MILVKSESYSHFSLPKCVWTIGNFDGVHIGHRRIISHLVEMAKELSLPSVVMGFDRSPKEILRPEIDFVGLFSKVDLYEQLKILGVDYYLEIPFTKALSLTGADEFFKKHIIQKLHPQYISVGHDFGFGRNREGGLDLLEKAAHEFGYLYKKCDPVSVDGEVVSTTRIKSLLKVGEIEQANKLLGRSYYFSGEVIKGKQLGQTIGFPTANVKLTPGFHMANGVYKSCLEFENQFYPAISNIGVRPTLSQSDSLPLLETHVLNKKINLYGKSIKIHFEKYIRPEKKFMNMQELKDQIHMDIEMAK
jgi:riboflavin kinase/FMN adenylyltransferase